MKKIYAILIQLIIGLKLIANPIALPTIEISELFFDNSNNWKLELAYYGDNQNGLTIDSIYIYSTTDTVKLPNYIFSGYMEIFVITKDSLDADFQIKRQGDTIKVVSYCMEQQFEDVLIFGKCQGACINYPREGQSISKYWMYFVKDNSPSIGGSNDTTGMCGTIKGIIYDKYLTPVSQKKFQIDYQFETSENGEYSTRVYSKPTTLNRLNQVIGQYTTRSVSITEINYVMEPDSVIEIDIYLLDTLSSGFNDLTLNNIPIKIYPNPASERDKLTVEIDLPVKTSDIWIEIKSIDGKLIKKEKVTNTKSQINTSNLNGICILNVLFDKQVISSNRILIINE
jgi:hypothetical protein